MCWLSTQAALPAKLTAAAALPRLSPGLPARAAELQALRQSAAVLAAAQTGSRHVQTSSTLKQQQHAGRLLVACSSKVAEHILLCALRINTCYPQLSKQMREIRATPVHLASKGALGTEQQTVIRHRAST
jgi:hypothetical protein